MPRLKSSRILLFALFLLQNLLVYAQQPQHKSSMDLLKQQDFKNPVFEPHKRSFLLLKNKNPLIRYNPVSMGFGVAMYTYQNVISPQFSAGCLYSPSCSEYSKSLIKDLGLVKGIVFTADRLTRCNRMAAQDIKKTYYNTKDFKVHESTDIYHIHK